MLLDPFCVTAVKLTTMLIKQIELIGFKSFADRISFSFHSGITSIVGPNGCGKSNIVDAFRWVLGEQSAKSLRGERMEEVIFQGSSTKKQKAMAEVTLTFSQSSSSPTTDNENGNGSISGASDEISVTRRLYRSGESEYLINKQQCRLKDIRDMFLDTGLDVKSYSILDQGKIGEIINAKPIDRRFLIEEIAGVMKYKVRKAEAISKLESSKQNLQRINDIVFEVKRQINSLDRLVKKAERYKRLLYELKTVELRIAKREHIRLSDLLNSLMAEIDSIKEADSVKRGELSTIENFIETRRLEISEKDRTLSELEKKAQEKERLISDIEKNMAILRTQIESKKLDILRFRTQKEEMNTKKIELEKKLSEVERERLSMLSTIKTISEELSEKEDTASDISTDIDEKESEIELMRKELFKVSEMLGNKKNELHTLYSSNENLKYKESVSIKDINSIKEGLSILEKTIIDAEGFIGLKTEEIKKLQSEKERLFSEITKLDNEIEGHKGLILNEREALASNTARLNSLKELIIDKSLTDIFKKGSEIDSPCEQCYKMLSDVITANSGFEAAIEAALSDKVNSLIMDELEDVLSAIRVIKEKHLGRTAILYTGIKGQEPENMPQISRDFIHEAFIGRALDFISIDDADVTKTANAVLKDTYIIKDLQAAIEILNSGFQIPQNLILVTLDGEVITGDGWIFAGFGKEILKRKREIKELTKTINEQQDRINILENTINSLTTDLSSKKESLKSVDDLLMNAEKDLSLCCHSLKSNKEEMEKKLKRLSYLDSEITIISHEKESLNNLIASKTEEIKDLEREKDRINSVITEMQQALMSKRAEYEGIRSNLTDMKLSIASYREKIDSLKREEENARNAIKELEEKQIVTEKEIYSSEEKIRYSSEELERLESYIKTVVIETDIINKELNQLRDNINSENQELISKENALKGIRLQIDELSSILSDMNSKAIENRLIKENIESSIMQKYGLDIKVEDINIEESDPIDDTNRLSEINEKIREIGPVNLGTIEEYEELKNRYDFLTKQQQDLTMSIAELEEAISRINSKTKRKLREAYDALRVKFAEVFTMLFGGGKADIILTDEDNILESGLEIIAQPPGKKLQNLNLLSGGEKALASLSLLFAGFLIKPSPLCILDEADAPLDESNTVRFARMIKELSSETQFIIITHNKTTMEVADYLYGITMEEPGVSKAISLQLTEN